MDNPEKLGTLDTQDTGQVNVRENRRAIKIDNPETLATLDTQEEKTEGPSKLTIQRHWQHWERKTQDEIKKSTTQQRKFKKKMSNTDPTKNWG